MLLSTWVMTGLDDGAAYNKLPGNASLCLDFRYTPGCMRSLYEKTGAMEQPGTFSIFLSANSFAGNQVIDTAMDALLTLFFQPCFYVVNNAPVVFTSTSYRQDGAAWLLQLAESCKRQGFSDLVILCPAGNENMHATGAEYYLIAENDYNLGTIIEKWTAEPVHPYSSLPLHLLITGNSFEEKCSALEIFLAQEQTAMSTRQYAVAERLYVLQAEQVSLVRQLQQQKTNEDNLRLYLEIQKKDLAKALDWYYYEHEILPLWYKQFGHIIKVIMGKRSFRSLFNDNVKKYKE